MSDQLDKCPVCNESLPSAAEHQEANKAHVAACIKERMSHQLKLDNEPEPVNEEGEDEEPRSACPVCHSSLTPHDGFKSEAARETHIATCIENVAAPSASIPSSPPGYDEHNTIADSKISRQAPSGPPVGKTAGSSASTPSKLTKAKEESTISSTNRFMEKKAAVENDGRRPSMFSRLASKLKTDTLTPEEKKDVILSKADSLMEERWGQHGTPTREMVLRYWNATRMTQHWEYLRSDHPRRFKRALRNGFMEPIPTEWVQDRRLAWQYPDFSTYENPAEERLYYLLNNGVMPDGTTHEPILPLKPATQMYQIIKRGNERNARQVLISPEIVRQFRSPGDVFQSDRQIKSHEYSPQVPNVVYETRRQALHELADGIIHGTDHLETMILIDVSTSMTWNPHGGMVGPDGIRRFHDQPANIRLTEHLVHRVLHHMIPRAQREHPQQRGIDTVTFSTYGHYVGQLTANNFQYDWRQHVGRQIGGGTQVMQGWQVVKQTYFEHQHKTYGHGRYDPIFGWQATPGMSKLSLLVFLDGEANDMDEFELELLGETWAYVTIALVGMENCPHHHSHAIELDRVARFNPHVGFLDVHGRVLERLVVQDLLASVYPVDPPTYEEILKPEFDLKAEELPGYSA